MTCMLGVALSVIVMPPKPDKLSTNDHLTASEFRNSAITQAGEGMGSGTNDPSFGEIGCAKAATADAIIVQPNLPKRDWLVTSPDNKYGHGTPCPDQFIVEVQNTLFHYPFWIVGAEAQGDWPETEIGCKLIKIEVASYGLVPFKGWVKDYQYTIRGKWENKYGFGWCEAIYIDAPPSLIQPSHYYYKIRVATKVTTFGGKKMRAQAGIIFV